MSKKLLALVMVIAPAISWAEADFYIPPPAPPPSPGSTINQGSNVGQNSQKKGSGANNAAGAALIAAGAALMANPPTVPMGAMLMAMGMMALAQGSHDSGAAGQSAATGAASVYNQGRPITQNPKGTADFNSAEIKKAAAELAKHGYEVTPAGVKQPDGTTIPAAAFNSKESMKAAGIDPAVLAKLDEIDKSIAKQYSVSSVPTAGGGGGGGGGNAYDTGGSGSDGNGGGGYSFALTDAARKALMAGKTVNLDGEPIGVAGANIFDMIHSCYQKKRTGEQFMEGEEVSVRAPASVRGSKKTK